MKVKIFPVKYVNRLIFSLVITTIVSIVIIALLIFKYNETSKERDVLEQQVASYLGISDLYNKDKVAARIEIVLEEARLSKIKSFVKKTNPKLSYTKADEIVSLEKKYSVAYNVPLERGLAVTLTESRFIPGAVSPTGPIGLKQIASTYWAKQCKTSANGLYNVETNIRCGYYILATHYAATGDWGKVSERYYGGTPNENRVYRELIERNRKIVIKSIT